MARTRQRRAPMAEINVVPYIDVMLVLLVIFMITAPLLSQGVKVDLPQANAEPIEQKNKEPLVVSIDVKGNYYINVGGDEEEPVELESIAKRVEIVLRKQPGTPVAVRGDKDVGYGKVIELMTILQQAGAESVGMLTDPLEYQPKK